MPRSNNSSSLDRRGFLAAAALPAAASLSPFSGGGQPLVMPAPIAAARPAVHDVDRFYVTTSDRGDGRPVPAEVHTDRINAKRAKPRGKIASMRFQAIGDARRFRVLVADWSPREPSFVDGHPSPASLVDTPVAVEGHEHAFDDLVQLLNRDAALALAAQFNAEVLNDAAEPSKLAAWHVVVEAGVSPCATNLTIELNGNGIGAEVRRVELPLKLVRPCETELRKFPLPVAELARRNRAVASAAAER